MDFFVLVGVVVILFLNILGLRRLQSLKKVIDSTSLDTHPDDTLKDLKYEVKKIESLVRFFSEILRDSHKKKEGD